ncbi:MAG: uroporphyrinogen decarboxylase family protein [bacterium]
MTGIERVKAAFKGKRADRVACYPIVSGLAARAVGRTLGEYYTDTRVLAAAQLALYQELRQDVVVMMGDLFLEVEAMGARVEFPDDDMPRLRSYLLEDKGTLAALEPPDPAASGRLPGYFDACRQVAAEVRESAVGAVLSGPWTLAVNLRGAENLIYDTSEDPKFVHEIMGLTTEVAKRTGAAAGAAGAGLSFSEAPASLSLISPKIFREFVLPYDREVVSFLRERRMGVTLHVCGFIDPIVDDVLATGCAAVSMDKPSSLEKMLQAARGRAVTIGNVSTSVFVEGSMQDVEDEVARCLAAAAGCEGFILSTGCEISVRGDLDKVKWFCQRAASLGELTQDGKEKGE